MQRSNVIDVTPWLRQVRPAANDTASTTPNDGLDAMGPEPRAAVPLSHPTSQVIHRAQAVLADFALMYSPLWLRLTHWPNVLDALRRVALGLFLGGVVGAIASCVHGG
jgi:hypothetical protein